MTLMPAKLPFGKGFRWRMKNLPGIFALFIIPVIFSFGKDSVVSRSSPIILRTLPHDPLAFTQGLLYYNGLLYESTGLYGRSSLRTVDPSDGRVIKNVPVPDIFGEGLARMGAELVQLSWKEKAALVYSIQDLALKNYYGYQGEGWGLTADSATFIMSSGSDTLFFRAKDFSLRKKLAVTLEGRPVKNLNELEYVHGLVYANIWYDTTIVAIDLKTGHVTRIIDCGALLQKAQTQSADEVLNGIAYNPKTETFYLTGKDWRWMFEVKF
jgi:glutamine cyclotransferase